MGKLAWLVFVVWAFAFATPSSASPISFRIIDLTGAPGVDVKIERPDGKLIVLDSKQVGGQRVFEHQQEATFPTEAIVIISLPARKAGGQLTRDIGASTAFLAFSVRPTIDDTVIDIPVRLVDGVSQAALLPVLKMGTGDALEKLVLLQQAFSVWIDASPNDSLTKDIAREWADTIFRAATARQRELVIPLRFDRAVKAAIDAAFSDDEAKIAEQFEPRFVELDDQFWFIPRQTRQILQSPEGCAVAKEAANYLVKRHYDDESAAGRRGIDDAKDQVASVVSRIVRTCNDPTAHEILARFDQEAANNRR